MKILTLGDVLRIDPTKPTQQVDRPMADDFGRTNLPTREPIVGSMLQPRVIDRYRSIAPPWKPEEIVQALLNAERGDLTQQADLFEHMEDRDGALLGFMQTRRLAPCGLKWSIEPADDSKEAEAIAEMCRAEMRIPKFRIAFRKMTDAIGKGMSVQWLDWQVGGRHPSSRYRVDGIHWINTKRLRFHWQREELLVLPDLTGMGDDPIHIGIPRDTQGFPLPPWKALVHKTEVKIGHPAKVGVLRNVVFDFLARNYAVKDFMVYCDIFGMPLRWGKYQDGASDDDKAALATAMENLGTDAAAITSKMVEIEILEAKGQSTTIPYAELHKLCEHNMQMAILGQDQTNTHNAAGGRTQVKEGGAKVRQDLLEADCIDIEETLSSQLLYPMVGFSSFERPTQTALADGTVREVWPVADSLCPRMKLHYEPQADEESYAAVDTILIGVLGLPQTYGQLATRYNRELPPDTDPNERVVPVQAQQAATAEKDAQNVRSGKMSTYDLALRSLPDPLRQLLLSDGTTQQDPIDVLAERSVEADATAAMLSVIKRVVESAGDINALPQKLREAFDGLDAEVLEKLVARSSFVARMYGRAAAKKG